jgi:DNA-binding transcriptional MocR family regulator
MRTSRAGQIAEIISRLIDGAHLAPGQRVPSVRAAALQYGVSKNTIVEAYDRLVSAGALEPRAGSGFYVRQPRRVMGDPRPAHIAEAVDHLSLLREQLNQHYAVRLGDGRPPADWMEDSEIGRFMRPRGARAPGEIEHGYGTPQGFEPLRVKIAQTLIERSIQAGSEQVLLTFGANHGLDLIIRQFLEPGDTVFVDSPGYYPLFGKLRLTRANIVPIRRTAEGPDLEELEAKAFRHQPKLFFTQTLAHNPTGTSMGLAAMHQMLRIADRADMMIVEDDPFADILPPMTPRLAALDQLARVLYVGTFSKTLSASLRCGFIAGQVKLIRSLTDVKMLTVVNSSGYVERLVHDLIAGGHYRHHLKRLRQRISRASTTAVSHLGALDLPPFSEPAGGYYLWCPLPSTMDDLELARRAAKEEIFLAPSSIFTLDRVGYQPAIRINVAYADDKRFLSFLRRELAG